VVLGTQASGQGGEAVLDGIWISGGIEAAESGSYLVVGRLSDLAGNAVAQAGVIFNADPGPASFRILFRAADIARSGRDGPYVLVRSGPWTGTAATSSASARRRS